MHCDVRLSSFAWALLALNFILSIQSILTYNIQASGQSRNFQLLKLLEFASIEVLAFDFKEDTIILAKLF